MKGLAKNILLIAVGIFGLVFLPVIITLGGCMGMLLSIPDRAKDQGIIFAILMFIAGTLFSVGVGIALADMYLSIGKLVGLVQ